jgi:hypothetical protein
MQPRRSLLSSHDACILLHRLADREEAKAKLSAVRGWIEKGTLLAELTKYGQH